MSDDGGLQFYQEVQQWQSQRDLEYETWSSLLDGEVWFMWYDFVERGEPSGLS